jgi:ribonuclease VapC
MVIDSSALLAIFLGEPERKQFLDLMLQAGKRLISAGTVLETGIVLEAKRGDAAGREFDLFLVRMKIEVVAADADQIEIARCAWRSFGKGRHPAGLNFGDCFAYALSKSSGEPLLAKGQDFALTDVELCTT